VEPIVFRTARRKLQLLLVVSLAFVAVGSWSVCDRRLGRWFLGSIDEPLPWWRTILWWEARRLPYNALLGLLSCVALPVFLLAISRSGELKPGEDAAEPLALLAAPVLANIAYTFGWATELAVNGVRGSDARRVGPSLLRFRPLPSGRRRVVGGGRAP
jgi:hypothetical protein